MTAAPLTSTPVRVGRAPCPAAVPTPARGGPVAVTPVAVAPVVIAPVAVAEAHVVAAPARAAHGVPGFVKIVLDVTAAALLLLVITPVLLALALAVRADGGPVLFRQTRIGRDGREFRMVKFRSMVTDAEQHRPALDALDQGAGPLFKVRRDPRVTPVGRVLRRYSLDELPQLFNVLAGTMSLVGPRPPLPAEVARYTVTERRRLAVRPGMTGLWQVSGRSDLSWAESVALDLRYVEDWTPGMELRILAATARAVLTGRGAY